MKRIKLVEIKKDNGETLYINENNLKIATLDILYENNIINSDSLYCNENGLYISDCYFDDEKEFSEIENIKDNEYYYTRYYDGNNFHTDIYYIDQLIFHNAYIQEIEKKIYIQDEFFYILKINDQKINVNQCNISPRLSPYYYIIN